uniref:Uncharacterized protein n=1 Tax=Globodera rostochiensis TaxID=31243 RepID=A0A914IHN2_GLORO
MEPEEEEEEEAVAAAGRMEHRNIFKKKWAKQRTPSVWQLLSAPMDYTTVSAAPGGWPAGRPALEAAGGKSAIERRAIDPSAFPFVRPSVG